MNALKYNIRKSFFGVSSLYVVGIPMLLLSHIVLARLLSVSDFGVFTLTISLATVLAIPITGGLPMLLTREVAGYARNRNWAAYRTLLITAHTWVVSISIIVCTGLVIWWLMSAPATGASAIIVALLLPLLGLQGIRGGILKGLGRPMLSEIPAQIIHPSLLVVGYLTLAALGLASVNHALWWYLAVVLVVFLLASVMLARAQPDGLREITGDRSDLPRWRKAILPFTMLSATNTLSTQIGIILVGTLGTVEAVAQLGVAQRGAQLVVFPLMIMNTIIGPHFVSAHQSGSRRELASVARQAARLTLLASLPVSFVLLIFGPDLIRLSFGAPYDTQSYAPMAVLIVAQLLSVVLGSGGMLLSMSGHEKHAIYSQGLSLVIIAVVSAVLIERYGAVGAAVGVASGIVSAKLYAYVQVRRILSVSPAII